MSARPENVTWRATFDRYGRGDTTTWTVEGKRRDGTPYRIANVFGERQADGRGRDLTLSEARAVASLIANAPRILGALFDLTEWADVVVDVAGVEDVAGVDALARAHELLSELGRAP